MKMKNVLTRNLTKSEDYWARAKRTIPAGTQCLSKGPTQFVDGVAPKYLQRGQGCHVWDADGNEYIDYGMACRPLVLGYCYPAVDEAIIEQLKAGITFTLMHPLEVELSELLIEVIPCAEMVRFGKNGSDVTSTAVRLARAYTGRDKILCCGYHGWQDWYAGATERNRGVPAAVRELTIPFPYNNIEKLERLFAENKGQVAAVIMEPVGVEAPESNFLEQVKQLTRENGAVLIFDEVITGFRFSLGGAQEYFNVIPDLATFGKGMANGMPISAIVGRQEIMQELESVFFSLTFGGEALSLAASVATIHEIKQKNVIEHLWKQGSKIKNGYNQLVREKGLEDYTECVGYPPSTLITFRSRQGEDALELKSLFQQESIKRGILFTAYNSVSYSHSDGDIAKTLEVYADAMEVMKRAIEEGNVTKYLEGKAVQPVFRTL